MKIDKIINNNIISAFDEDGREIVVMGRGLGFKKKSGQEIEDSQIEKIFRMADQKSSDQLKTILAEIPLEHARISHEIISYAKKNLDKKLNRNIYITLTDHISFAIQRNSEGANFKNALLWEIKKFYQKEYQIGLHAVTMIKEQLKISLPEDEAGSIALHIVNAEFDTSMDKAVDITHLIQEVLNIVKYYYQIDVNEDTIHYERFITHLKFFAQRIFTGKMLQSDDGTFLEMIKAQYEKDYKCTEKIEEFIRKEYGYVLTEEEKVYLTVHIRRVTNTSEGKKESS